MKRITQGQIEQINAFIQAGYSSRDIANIMGIGKSSVNNHRNSFDTTKGFNGVSANAGKVSGVSETISIDDPVPSIISENQKGPRILVFDLETSAAEVLAFGRFKVNLSQDHVMKEGGWILCASWKWLGDDSVQSIALRPDEIAESNDFRIVAEMFELFDQADAVVAHNGVKFDVPVLQARCAYYNIGALPSVKVLDTLVIAKKNFKVPSNSLDSLAGYFGLGSKIKHSGISLWKKVQQGCPEAMQEMLEYCEKDTALLEELYLTIRAYGRSGDFNAGLSYNDGRLHCRTCGSTNMSETGRTVQTSLSKFSEVRCNDCGAVHRTRESLTTAEQRSTLTI